MNERKAPNFPVHSIGNSASKKLSPVSPNPGHFHASKWSHLTSALFGRIVYPVTGLFSKDPKYPGLIELCRVQADAKGVQTSLSRLSETSETEAVALTALPNERFAVLSKTSLTTWEVKDSLSPPRRMDSLPVDVEYSRDHIAFTRLSSDGRFLVAGIGKAIYLFDSIKRQSQKIPFAHGWILQLERTDDNHFVCIAEDHWREQSKLFMITFKIDFSSKQWSLEQMGFSEFDNEPKRKWDLVVWHQKNLLMLINDIRPTIFYNLKSGIPQNGTYRNRVCLNRAKLVGDFLYFQDSAGKLAAYNPTPNVVCNVHAGISPSLSSFPPGQLIGLNGETLLAFHDSSRESLQVTAHHLLPDLLPVSRKSKSFQATLQIFGLGPSLASIVANYLVDDSTVLFWLSVMDKQIEIPYFQAPSLLEIAGIFAMSIKEKLGFQPLTVEERLENMIIDGQVRGDANSNSKEPAHLEILIHFQNALTNNPQKTYKECFDSIPTALGGVFEKLDTTLKEFFSAAFNTTRPGTPSLRK
jgi:hypothetical protein